MFLRRVNKQARLPGPRQPLSQSSSSSPKPHLVSGLPGTGRVSPAASKELTPPTTPTDASWGLRTKSSIQDKGLVYREKEPQVSREYSLCVAGTPADIHIHYPT